MHAKVLIPAVLCNLYFDSHNHSLHCSDIPSILVYQILCMKWVYCRYQNNDQSVSLIPKWDPGITNFSILDPVFENSILGLQSLLVSKLFACLLFYC